MHQQDLHKQGSSYLWMFLWSLLLPLAGFSQAVSFKANVNDIVSTERLGFSEVIFRNLADSTEISAVADYEGNVILALKPGNYRVEVRSSSYEPYTIENLEVKNEVSDFLFGLKETMGRLSIEEVAIRNNTSRAGRKEDKDKRMKSSSGGSYRPYIESEGRSTGYYSDMPVTTAMDISRTSVGTGSGSTNYASGSLTGGEVNDFSKWKFWTDIVASELQEYERQWMIRPADRFCVQVKFESGYPIPDAQVKLLCDNKIVWQSRSDNTGKAELWGGMFDKDSLARGNYQLQVSYKGKMTEIKNPVVFANGINFLTLNEPCESGEIVDIALVVDATGSMGDEIEALKLDLLDAMQQVAKGSKFKYRFGSVFYRDRGDDYVVKRKDFTTSLEDFLPFIKEQRADGGGDYPEAVAEAMEESIGKLEWSKDARARLMFLLLDAPPHEDEASMEKVKKYTRMAAEKGIRVIPVGCTGINKSTEYLLRSIALATNGTYLFTSHHSGIGYGHMEPTTDGYDVEKFNTMLARIIWSFTDVRSCTQDDLITADSTDTTFVDSPFIDSLFNNPDTSALLPVDTIIDSGDTTAIRDTNHHVREPLKWKFYPNPTSGLVTVELTPGIGELYLADMSGKLVRQWLVNGQERMLLDISDFSSGMYFLGYFDQDDWVSGKLILVNQ